MTKEKAEIEIQLQVSWADDWDPVFHANGFSFPQMPVITQESPKAVQLFHWGLIPHWVKTMDDADKLRAQTLNARSETVFEKPSFRTSVMRNRCLVIADGFFEWMDFQKKKYPHYIYLPGNRICCFAGLYAGWADKQTGELIHSFSILTTEANPMMARIHNLKQRMPVIVPPASYADWLNPALGADDIRTFFQPYPDEDMAFHTISKRISSRTENSNVPEVMERMEYPELALL